MDYDYGLCNLYKGEASPHVPEPVEVGGAPRPWLHRESRTAAADAPLAQAT